MKPANKDLEILFNHHTPTPHDGVAIGFVRGVLRQATSDVLAKMPECPEVDLFVNKMCEAMYHANAGIARRAARSNG